MNADREPNRLPLRAGAMLLFAVAVVFIGLGWHSAATADSDPEAGLEAAARSNSATASATSASPSSSAAAGSTRICVINAGSVSGLAAEVTDDLKQKGFRTAPPRNYDGGGFTENTIYYDDADQKAEADRVAEALGGDASVEERTSRFTLCRDGIPVVVVTR
ncbi:hypothetical protein GCM10009624_26390 [Gordonia sinesedis]